MDPIQIITTVAIGVLLVFEHVTFFNFYMQNDEGLLALLIGIFVHTAGTAILIGLWMNDVVIRDGTQNVPIYLEVFPIVILEIILLDFRVKKRVEERLDQSFVW